MNEAKKTIIFWVLLSPLDTARDNSGAKRKKGAGMVKIMVNKEVGSDFFRPTYSLNAFPSDRQATFLLL